MTENASEANPSDDLSGPDRIALATFVGTMAILSELRHADLIKEERFNDSVRKIARDLSPEVKDIVRIFILPSLRKDGDL